METRVRLTVRAAEKRDAGRGVARLPDAPRRELGVLSGETIVIEGDQPTVATVWPSNDDDQTIRIDADTRSNAGITVGESVTVRPVTIDDATAVVLELPVEADESLIDAVRRELQNRPVSEGDSVRLEPPGVRATITETSPDGTVRVTERTRIQVREQPEQGPQEGSTDTASSSTVDPASTEGLSPEATYEDIGGLDDELDQIREMIELPLSEPALFRRLGIDPPSGVLLYGPPGTGKTLIAEAVANEVDAHFEVIDGPEIVSKYKGESEEALRATFDRAVENAPAIVFIDEIDSIAGTRDEDADMENRVVAQLLTLMDGLESRGRVIVIGATNRVDVIDPALRRGGRFDREIEIGPPDVDGRREILEVHVRGMPLAEDVDLEYIANRTHGFVGADIHQLVTEAAMCALREREDREELLVTRADFESALAAVDPSAMREYVAETPHITFDDVGGLEEAKEILTEAVEWPLAYGPLFEATNTDPPAGILLYGPPGTGKTLLARALAGESDVNFVSVAGPELLDKYVGESEKAVREVFDRARQAAPAILFFDEIDAIASVRGESSDTAERVVSQFLTELGGLADDPNLVVLAATNRREALDPALLRPGRLEVHVEVPQPDEAARLEILRVHARGKPLEDDVDLEELAAKTAGFSGAQLESVLRTASMRAIRELADEIDPESAAERAHEISITRAHIEEALERVRE